MEFTRAVDDVDKFFSKTLLKFVQEFSEMQERCLQKQTELLQIEENKLSVSEQIETFEVHTKFRR